MDAPLHMHVGAVEEPHLEADEVIVSVGAAGICAGDIYYYLGKNPYAAYPQVCGHEIAGVVNEVGANVRGIEIGAKVVVEPFLGCGHCYPCRVGKSNCCANLRIIGVHLPGGYAERVKAPATHIHRVPDGLSLAFASFAEPVAVGVQACRRGEVGAEYVLILGCGPIGLALIEVARSRDAHVVATDVVQSRLEVAAQLGAETLLSDDRLLSTVLEQTHGEGAPVVIEATGNAQVMQSTAALVAAGGRIVIVGLVKEGVPIAFPGLDLTRKEMTILGSRASVNCFPEALELLASGAIQYPRIATEFDLWDAPRIFAELAEHPAKVHKGVLMRDITS